MPDIADVAWSERDDRNTEAVPDGWPQGTMPAYVDETGRMMMGATKRFWNKINPIYQTSGTGDNYIVQTEVGVDQINLYELLCVRIDRSNTGTTPTLQFGATNARTIVKAGPSGYIPLIAGDLFAGNSHTFWYNGAFYVLTDPATPFGGPFQPLSTNLTTWAVVPRAAGYDNFAATPTSANLRALVSDESGTGNLLFQSGDLGTPTAGVLTNATGLPIGTGVSGLAANMAAFLAGGTSAQLKAAVTDETGSGALVFATSPTLVTPALGTPSALVLTNATGLPIAGGGTGQSTKAAAYDALSPTTTWGDIEFRGTANNTRLAASTAGYLLQTNGAGADPSYTGFTQTGTGAVAATYDAKLRSTALCVFDFMTAAQVADVQSRAFTLDVSTPVANWFAACLAQKKAGYAPSGRYRIDSQFLMDCASVPTTGFTIFGDGIQNTLFDATNVATIPAFKLFCSGGTTGSPISQNYAKILGIGFTANQNGQMFQVGLTNKADQINLCRLEIWLSNNSTGSSATLFEANNCYGCHFEFNGNTASTPRTILTLGAITAGSGYVNGTYNNVPLTGGNGGFATANITVAGGVVTVVTLVSGGFGYAVADTLSASNTNLGGSGTGFSIPVATSRVTTSCGVRLIQCTFSYFFLSIGGVNRAIYLTSGFSYGNVFVSPDLEIVDYCVVIDSANAQNNTFIGGQWAYYAYGVNTTAGQDNVFINNNINAVNPFFATGASVGIYEIGSRKIMARGSILTTGNGGIGYDVGAGGAVTQLTSRTTGVTLNKPSGAITLFSAAGTATAQTFTVTNSTVAATDTISFNQKSGTNNYITHIVAVAAGSFTVMFWTATTNTDSPVFNFNVIKGVSA